MSEISFDKKQIEDIIKQIYDIDQNEYRPLIDQFRILISQIEPELLSDSTLRWLLDEIDKVIAATEIFTYRNQLFLRDVESCYDETSKKLEKLLEEIFHMQSKLYDDTQTKSVVCNSVADFLRTLRSINGFLAGESAVQINPVPLDVYKSGYRNAQSFVSQASDRFFFSKNTVKIDFVSIRPFMFIYDFVNFELLPVSLDGYKKLNAFEFVIEESEDKFSSLIELDKLYPFRQEGFVNESSEVEKEYNFNNEGARILSEWGFDKDKGEALGEINGAGVTDFDKPLFVSEEAGDGIGKINGAGVMGFDRPLFVSEEAGDGVGKINGAGVMDFGKPLFASEEAGDGIGKISGAGVTDFDRPLFVSEEAGDGIGKINGAGVMDFDKPSIVSEEAGDGIGKINGAGVMDFDKPLFASEEAGDGVGKINATGVTDFDKPLFASEETSDGVGKINATGVTDFNKPPFASEEAGDGIGKINATGVTDFDKPSFASEEALNSEPELSPNHKSLLKWANLKDYMVAEGFGSPIKHLDVIPFLLNAPIFSNGQDTEVAYGNFKKEDVKYLTYLDMIVHKAPLNFKTISQYELAKASDEKDKAMPFAFKNHNFSKHLFVDEQQTEEIEINEIASVKRLVDSKIFKDDSLSYDDYFKINDNITKTAFSVKLEKNKGLSKFSYINSFVFANKDGDGDGLEQLAVGNRQISAKTAESDENDGDLSRFYKNAVKYETTPFELVSGIADELLLKESAIRKDFNMSKVEFDEFADYIYNLPTNARSMPLLVVSTFESVISYLAKFMLGRPDVKKVQSENDMAEDLPSSNRLAGGTATDTNAELVAGISSGLLAKLFVNTAHSRYNSENGKDKRNSEETKNAASAVEALASKNRENLFADDKELEELSYKSFERLMGNTTVVNREDVTATIAVSQKLSARLKETIDNGAREEAEKVVASAITSGLLGVSPTQKVIISRTLSALSSKNTNKRTDGEEENIIYDDKLDRRNQPASDTLTDSGAGHGLLASALTGGLLSAVLGKGKNLDELFLDAVRANPHIFEEVMKHGYESGILESAVKLGNIDNLFRILSGGNAKIVAMSHVSPVINRVLE